MRRQFPQILSVLGAHPVPRYRLAWRVKMPIGAAAMAFAVAAAPAAANVGELVSLTLPETVPATVFSESRSADVLVAQVLLDRSRHSPGVIDGVIGGNTRRAISAFERSQGLPVDGELDRRLFGGLAEQHPGAILQRYTITQNDVDGPFPAVPGGMARQARLDRLGFEGPAEALAEKFHMSRQLLEALNPAAEFGRAGTVVVVVAPGPDELPATVARIEVDKSASAVRAYSAAGELLATYPATIGSSAFPSPSGSMEVRAVAMRPAYYFDPEGRAWGPDQQLTIAPGPNNPVGTTWIDLTREGYGIHGTPEPRLIGKTASHGCVRLTNWDAHELATAVRRGTRVEFLES